MNNLEVEKEAIKYLKTKYKDKVIEKKKKGAYDLFINRNRYELKSTTLSPQKIYFRYLRESTYWEIQNSKYLGLIIVYNVGKPNKITHVRFSNNELRGMIDSKPEKWYKLKVDPDIAKKKIKRKNSETVIK